MYLIVTYQLKRIWIKKIIFCPFLALNVSKKGPNDQFWWTITRSFLVRFKKTKYCCNRDVEIYKNFYNRYNFGLSVKKIILGPRNRHQGSAEPKWPRISETAQKAW